MGTKESWRQFERVEVPDGGLPKQRESDLVPQAPDACRHRGSRVRISVGPAPLVCVVVAGAAVRTTAVQHTYLGATRCVGACSSLKLGTAVCIVRGLM